MLVALQVWSEAAKELAKYPEAVVTAIDPAGYPLGVRQRAPRYDSQTGEFVVACPSRHPVAAGPAAVLCHSHDADLRNLTQIQITGRLTRRTGRWVFISTSFRRPSGSQLATLWRLSRDMRVVGRRYLDPRGLLMPY